MKISKIASVTTLVLASAITAPAMATNYSGGWHSGCGTGGNTGDGCNAADYFADDLMYSLASDGISNAVVDGVTINASAYSDTTGHNYQGKYNYNGKDYAMYGDDQVEAAQMADYGSGYGVINLDEDGSSPEHSADNEGNAYFAGSKYNTYIMNDTDFDYVLISFDEEVNVTGATFSWLWKETDTQISVAALSDTSMLTSGLNTWGDIAGDALAVGSFDVLNCDDTDLAEISGLDNVYSQYWIIGAYNTVFGDIGHSMYDDGFKLASVGFNKKPGEEPPTTQVTEPGTFAMLFMGGALAMWRRKRNA